MEKKRSDGFLKMRERGSRGHTGISLCLVSYDPLFIHFHTDATFLSFPRFVCVCVCLSVSVCVSASVCV